MALGVQGLIIITFEIGTTQILFYVGIVISRCFRALPIGQYCSEGSKRLLTILQINYAINVISLIITQLARAATQSRTIIFRLKCCSQLLRYGATKNLQ